MRLSIYNNNNNVKDTFKYNINIIKTAAKPSKQK